MFLYFWTTFQLNFIYNLTGNLNQLKKFAELYQGIVYNNHPKIHTLSS